jgi:hypothetical protein
VIFVRGAAATGPESPSTRQYAHLVGDWIRAITELKSWKPSAAKFGT